jgi:hypothetical protein
MLRVFVILPVIFLFFRQENGLLCETIPEGDDADRNAIRK